ncbi:MAG: DUF4861 domain-containing protein [Bacteroidota bacterium]
MKITYTSLLFLMITVFTVLSACKAKQEATEIESKFTITNPLDRAREDVIISLKNNALSPFLASENITLSVPYQFNDNDSDGKVDELIMLMNLEANEKKILQASELISETPQVFPKRTQAEISHKINGEWKSRTKEKDKDKLEYVGGTFQNVKHLKVPEEHTDHSWYIRYEGPGWESDLVGYRFYLDWRNATDIFGKKTTDLVLQDVGQDGFDSYHEAADWGMDVLKVGKSLGIGALGMWLNGKAERVAETESLESKIISNGIIQSKVRTSYHAWSINDQKVDLISDLSINAGSRLTHHELELSENVPNICTGIVKAENAELFTNAQKGVSGWGYIATYGQQSLAADNLGMVVFFKNEDLEMITEDEHSHVVVLKPKHKKLEYYFAACWEQEADGITTKEAFMEYLNEQVQMLNTPIQIL